MGEVEKAVSDMAWKLSYVREDLDFLFEVLRASGLLKESVKAWMLKQLEKHAMRKYELVHFPCYDDKQEVLEELMREGKVVKTRNGWIKLAGGEKGGC